MEKNKDFIDGMFVFAPHPKSPDFVKAVLSIKPEEFSAWLVANKGKMNDKGFLPIQILQSQKGGWYAKVNDYVRQTTEKEDLEYDRKSDAGEFPTEDAPF